jgi:hypothetical protein
MSLEFSVDKDSEAFLEIPSFQAAGCLVEINGRRAGLAIRSGEQIPITSSAADGKNEITLTLLGTTANTFWPLHRTDTNWCMPPTYGHVEGLRGPFPREYQLAAFGMTGTPRIIVRDRRNT